MTCVSSGLAPSLRGRPIEDVKVDWERFVPPLRPVDLVVVDWDKTGSPIGAAADDSPSRDPHLPAAAST